MASTRNKNTLGDYQLEQRSLLQQAEYLTYIHGASGKTEKTMFSGDGLLSGRFASTELCNNATDVESYLYGIGTTNLVQPLKRPVAELKKLPSLNVIDRLPVYVAQSPTWDSTQRPLPS
jgi:hypothetical protein